MWFLPRKHNPIWLNNSIYYNCSFVFFFRRLCTDFAYFLLMFPLCLVMLIFSFALFHLHLRNFIEHLASVEIKWKKKKMNEKILCALHVVVVGKTLILREINAKL